jgi:hypothetical protein
MDCFHVKRMAQYKWNAVFMAQIRYPVPGKHALDTHDDVFNIGKYDLKENLGIGLDIFVQNDFTMIIKNTNIHLSCMQIDSAVVSMLLGVESHCGTSFD